MEGATESEINAHKEKEEKNPVKFEDLDGSGVTQNSEVVEDPVTHLDPEKSKTVFMNLINVDEQTQV